MGKTVTTPARIRLIRRYRDIVLPGTVGWTYAYGGFDETNTVTYGDNYTDWKKRLRDGRSATTTLSGTYWEYRGGSSSFARSRIYRYPTPGYDTRKEWSGSLGSGYLAKPTVSTLTYDKANNAAILKFNREVQDTQSSMLGGVFIAELGKTIKMIKNPLKVLNANLYDYVKEAPKSLRRRRALVAGKPTPQSTLKLATDSWLEFAFGMKPLVADVNDGLTALNELARIQPPSKVVYGVGQESRHNNVSTFNAAIGGFYVNINLFTIEKVSVKYHGAISLQKPTAAERFGLSWDQAVPTMWELIPFSFLVDYFSNIGDVIQANAINQASVLWCEKGYSKESKNCLFASNGGLIPEGNPAGFMLANASGRCFPFESISRVDVAREPFYGPYSPSLVFEIPGTGMKWLNLAALAVSTRRSSRSIYPSYPY